MGPFLTYLTDQPVDFCCLFSCVFFSGVVMLSFISVTVTVRTNEKTPPNKTPS